MTRPASAVRAEPGPDSTAERPTLSVDETADLLGISRWLVQQAVRRGELPAVRIGRRVLIPRVRLLAMLAGHTGPTAGAGTGSHVSNTLN